MANCHIRGFNLPFTELNYLIWFLCKSRLNTGDRTPDTLYIDTMSKIQVCSVRLHIDHPVFLNALSFSIQVTNLKWTHVPSHKVFTRFGNTSNEYVGKYRPFQLKCRVISCYISVVFKTLKLELDMWIARSDYFAATFLAISRLCSKHCNWNSKYVINSKCVGLWWISKIFEIGQF